MASYTVSPVRLVRKVQSEVDFDRNHGGDAGDGEYGILYQPKRLFYEDG